MKNRRKTVVLLSAVLVMTSRVSVAAAAEEDTGAEPETAAVSETAAEGSVLNIYTWNEEFKNRLEDYYPDYVVVDENTGTIGDVTVKWNITSVDNNAYQKNLDENLLSETTEADERVDIFLAEAEYVKKYADTDYTKSLAELGITEEDLAQQLPYTKTVAADAAGAQKGAAWQICPGVLIYRRDIAKEVLGTDDPDKVQEYLADWDTFAETSARMKEAGYSMTSTVYDTFRVFAGSAAGKWVVDGRLNLDQSILDWAELSKTMADAGETGTWKKGSSNWNEGFYTDSNVFCYFGPDWVYDFYMAGEKEGSVGLEGGWAVTEGPQSFFWGGTWICAAANTDNPSLIKEILLNLTCNEEIMTEMAGKDGDVVNHAEVLETLASDESITVPVLGGQNPFAKFLSAARALEAESYGSYDQVCSEVFQSAMKDYFEGNASLEEAEELYYKTMEERYPELGR